MVPINKILTYIFNYSFIVNCIIIKGIIAKWLKIGKNCKEIKPKVNRRRLIVEIIIRWKAIQLTDGLPESDSGRTKL